MSDNSTSKGGGAGATLGAVIGLLFVIAITVHACKPGNRTVQQPQQTAPQVVQAQQPAQAAEASQPGNILFEIGKKLHGSLTKGGHPAGELPLEQSVDTNPPSTLDAFVIKAPPIPEGSSPDAPSSFFWVRNHSGYGINQDPGPLDPSIRQVCIDYETHKFVVIDSTHACIHATANGFQSRDTTSRDVQLQFVKMN